MDARQILLKYWGYHSFRPLQEEIIESVLEGKDTLALLPTGGGKSICFQVPAMMTEGLCVVVTPLIALMKDQVEKLTQKGIKASAIYSGMHPEEISTAIDNCMFGNTKFLYLSPERLESDLIRTNITEMNVSLLAVDEAHCISQWGYDFRPTYLNIAAIREFIPDVPALALTASATGEVMEDIQNRLRFRKKNHFRLSFERKNISYLVIHEEDKIKRLTSILNRIKGSGIVYIRSRKRSVEVAKALIKNNIQADFYHAGLDTTSRTQKQERWMRSSTGVMVCTNAFGMGIDKPDVRFVVHLDIPESLESYYQESGRAGRDGKKAWGIVLYENSDIQDLESWFKTKYPEPDFIKQTYRSLGNYYHLAVGSGEGQSFDFDISRFCNTYDLPKIPVYNALKLLEKDGYLSLQEVIENVSKIRVRINKDRLYKFQVENRRFDKFIKTILRSYSGLFTDFRKIYEGELAQRMETDKKHVTDLLRKLHKFGIITYIPMKNKPQVVFTRERMDDRDLSLSPDSYRKRKKADYMRLMTVTEYISNRTVCRSQFILSYFGEKDAKRCGKCDVCVERNKMGVSDYEYQQILQIIRSVLSEEALTVEEVIRDKLKSQNEEKAINVIRFLLDNGQLAYDDDNRIRWNDKDLN